MTVKEFINLKGIKQTKISKETQIDISMLNKHLNEVQLLPLNKQGVLGNYLGLSIEEIKSNRVLKTLVWGETV